MNFNQIKSIIDKHDKIFISSHINPDGDSVGSAYAMYKYLDSIIMPNNDKNNTES